MDSSSRRTTQFLDLSDFVFFKRPRFGPVVTEDVLDSSAIHELLFCPLRRFEC